MKKRILSLIMLMILMLSSCAHPGEAETESTTDILDNIETQIIWETTEPPVPKTTSASFVGCGDNIIYYGTWRDAKSKSDGTREYNFKPIYKNVESIISGADIAFINQETICAQSFEPSTYPGFNSPVDLTYDIADIGFDVVSLANNHMLDKGALGLREAFDNWNERGLHVIGAYEEKAEGRYITYYEKNGIKIAFVAYTEFVNLYEDPAKEGLYGPFLKYSDVAGDVKEAHDNSDFVIVSIHWGEEGSFVPSNLQKEYAGIMAENGADVILGHHPHVLQPIEWIDGKDGHKALCAYSLGNFVHEQAWDYNVPGGMLTFNIEKTGEERAKVVSPAFIPTVCHYPRSFYDNVVYLLEDYTEELASKHAVKTYYNHTISLEKLKKYVTDTIAKEFLPDYLK